MGRRTHTDGLSYYCEVCGYYCEVCGLGFGEYVACDSPSSALEAPEVALERREAAFLDKIKRFGKLPDAPSG